MSLPIESPPEGTPPELAEWLNRQLIIIAGEFDKLIEEVDSLKERVESLENP